MQLKKMSLISLLIALCVAGASIKIPAIVSSVALDMVPALLGGIMLGSIPGAIIAFIAHLLSALIGGMPMGAFHLVVGLEMAVLVWLFAMIFKKGHRLLASILFVVGNTVIAPLPFLFLMGVGFYIGLMPSLLIGALVNTVLALLLAPQLIRFYESRFSKEAIR
ncbi:ECF transporter S component [Niallia sp. Krafla_26]|uniref:ECF transporter S component n=1 Tax=Niallia sp. Krafla_26 TaxID=3064703 RepID=UPI003D1740A6